MKRRLFTASVGLPAFFSSLNFGFGPQKNISHQSLPIGFGPSPAITDRLQQGFFINYGTAAKVPDSDFITITMPTSGPV